MPLVMAQNANLEHFEKKIRPVLMTRCAACHGASAQNVQGGLKLNSVTGIRQGGNSGSLINTADPELSLLLRALRHTDKELKMPPGKPLPPEMIADFEQWVQAGAVMPEESAPVVSQNPSTTLWSLKEPVAATPPQIRHSTWAKNEIDRFIAHTLEEKGLTPSPEADKRTLIRRVYYTLTGLPPAQSEIDAFARDQSPNSYEKLVDKLLASPRYGERWARHWLDVSRYADAVNNSVNAPQRYGWSYTYRDWVIQSLNEDLPYDQFLKYQIAADRIPGTDPKHLAALGFLSLGREFPKSFPETVDDRIDAVTRGMLGLTVACARCHDHKYDPIPTKDYYSFYSIFSNIREPEELPLLKPVSNLNSKDQHYLDRLAKIRQADADYRNRRHREMVVFFKEHTADYLIASRDSARLSNTEFEELVRDRQLNSYVLKRWNTHLQKSRETKDPVFRLWHEAAAIQTEKFSEQWLTVLSSVKDVHPLILEELKKKPAASLQEVADVFATVLLKHDQESAYPQKQQEALREVMRGDLSPADVPLKDFGLIFTEGDSNNTYAIHNRYVATRAQYAYDDAPPRAMAVEDVPEPKIAHVFVRGNPSNPGVETPPRFLSCIDGPDSKVFTDGSGRFDLANAIADSKNPLTARVMVNRVWMHHFGSGLVRTPSDFGLRGEAPTHPELLDVLAVRFMESGWSLKKLHREILLSATFRQASIDNETGQKLDPENLLLWKMSRQRLDIESLRDSMLMASGTLDLKMGGVAFPLLSAPSVPRRSIYGFIERGRIPGILSAFDFASPDQHSPMRFVTTVPQQALFFLNSPFVTEQAQYTAERSGSGSPETRIKNLYQFIFGRDAKLQEISAGKKFIQQGDENTRQDAAASPWKYGVGQFITDSGKVTAFREFSSFVNDNWQGGPVLPAGDMGRAFLHPTGGEPGIESNQAVVRRWISPKTGTISIEGTLRHGQAVVWFGDGVRGRVVSSKHGEIASWSVNGSSAETRLNGIKVETGDIIDFIVDSRKDFENDGFGWTPIIKMGEETWNAKEDFRGPAAKPLDVWAQYAQVLLQTNEFAFVD